MDPKGLIEDEIYENLRGSFLHTGRGRPKMLPKTDVNNKLLVQLSYLREDGQKPENAIVEWLADLRPEVRDMAAATNHFAHLAIAAQRKFVGLPPEEREDFLQQHVDLDYISAPLSSVGITRRTFLCPPTGVAISDSVTNQVIIELEQFRVSQGQSQKLMFQWIHHVTGIDICRLPSLVSSLMRNYSKVRKCSLEKKEQFLATRFCIISQPQSQRSVPPVQSLGTLPFSQLQNVPVLKASKKKCLDCQTQREEINALKDVIKSVQIEKGQAELKVFQLQQDAVHNSATVEKLEVAQHELTRCNIRMKHLSSKVKKQARQLRQKTEQITILCKKQNELKRKLSDSRKAIRRLKMENENIQKDIGKQWQNSVLHENEGVSLKEGNKNAYSKDVRKTAIALQCEAGVSAANVKTVIDIVARNIFHHSFSQNLPCGQTALNMVDEGHVISNMQTVEAVLKSSNCTFHADGTSRDHQKIVGTQLSLDSGEVFYLGFEPVAKEDSNTLLELALSVLRKLSNCYTDESLSSKSPDALFRELLSKITSVMTDRAASMKAFDKKMQEFLCSELGINVRLNFLHCNAHFLLGLSAACDKALVGVEKSLIEQSGELLGRDKDAKFRNFKDSETATSRTIRTACDILGPRGDQKNGCRSDWITFCPESQIPSFKGNRFNCFFQAAAALIHHHEQMMRFFSSGILPENVNLKIQSVNHDVGDVRILCLLCAVAVFYVKVTGPYWTLVNSSVKYYDFYLYVQKMHVSFQQWCEDPSELLKHSFKSVFGEDVNFQSKEFSSVHDFLTDNENVDVICNALKALSCEALIVTERQLADFLSDGDFSDVSDTVKEQIEHCPLTNLVGESAFGDFDYDVGKRRNTSLHNRSTVHCIKRNKTMSYIQKKSREQQSSIFKIARSKASFVRQESRAAEEKVTNAIRERFLENQQKKIDKETNAIDKRSAINETVQKHGGPCLRQEDVVELEERLIKEGKSQRQITEVFKDEIRYQKHINGRKMKFGTLDYMKNALQNCLAPRSPPAKRPRN